MTNDHPKAGSRQKAAVTSFAAGAIAGALAKTTIAPLDRTKINFQVSSSKRYSFRAAIRFLVNSYKTEGFFSLWRGNSATLARVVPFAAVQFMSHEQYKHILHVDTHSTRLTPHLRFIAGSMAGVTATICTYPLDTARARMAVSAKCQYHTLTSVFVKVCREEGPLRLYRGMLPTCMGSIPYAGTSFFVYESLKILYYDLTGQSDAPNRTIPTHLRLAMGACGGFLGQTSSYPLDIVRRRLQTGRTPTDVKPTILRLLVYIARTEGIIGGLYKGLSMNLIKGPVAVAISFTTHDIALRRLRQISYFAETPSK